MLVNDPDFGTSDSTFKGNTMTYYGRWTYKFEEAARQGAKGCLIVHDNVASGYGFWVVQNSWNTSKLYLDTRGKINTPALLLDGYRNLLRKSFLKQPEWIMLKHCHGHINRVSYLS